MKKHGGDRGDRHKSCRSPTIVLYRAVKVLPGTAGTVLNFIIIKRKNTTPVPTAMFNPSSTQSSPAKLSKYVSSHLRATSLVLTCFAKFRIVWGGGGGYVIKSKHNITIPCPILCL